MSLTLTTSLLIILLAVGFLGLIPSTYASTVYITITSSPTGSGYVTVDGYACTTPYSDYLVVGSQHTIAANSPVVITANQERYIYSSWSDSGAQSHQITIIESNTFTAFFTHQWYFLTSSSHGTPSGAGWYNSGATASSSITTPVSGGTGIRYVNNHHTGTGSCPTGAGASVSFTITQYSTVVFDQWTTQYYLTVNTAHSSATGAGWYNSGASAYAGVSSSPVSGGTGIRYVFTTWGGDASGSNYAQSNAITMSAPKTATAGWTTQYYLTVSSTYGSPGGAGWYNSGTSVSATVNRPISGGTDIRYETTGYTGTGSAPSSTTWGVSYTSSFSITQPSSVTFNWATQYRPTITLGGTSASDTVSITARTLYGTSATVSGLYTSWYDWCDGGTTLTFSATSSSGKQCRSTTSRTWTVSSAFSSTPIWDRVIINSFSVLDNRISVGETPSFTVAGVYEYGGTWSGTYSLNDTITKSTVGRYGFKVSSITDSNYGLTAFQQTAGDLFVVWDRLSITYSANATWITVGNYVGVTVTAIREFDNSIVSSWAVYSNRNGTYFATGNFTDMRTSDGLWQYAVKNATDNTYGITAFSSNTLTVSWTGMFLETYQLLKDATRVNVGTAVYLRYRIRFSSNLSDVPSGSIWVNGTEHSISSGWANFTVTQSSPCIKTFVKTDINVNGFHAYGQIPANPTIIWDRVNITSLVPSSIRVGVGATATFLASGLFESDGTTWSGAITLNDSSTKLVVGKFGYKVASITDPTYNITTFTTRETYVIFDALNVTAVAYVGFDASGNLQLTPTVKFAYDGTTPTGFFDVNGTKGAIGSTIAVPFTQSGKLIIKGWNETTYGITRAIANKTWQVAFSQYAVTTTANKTVTASYLSTSDMLQIVATTATAHVKCPTPYIVQIDGVAKAQGDGWSYSEATGVLQVTLPSSWANVYFSQPSSSGGGGGGGGGFLYPTEVFLQGIFREEKKAIVGDRVMLILLYGLDNPTQKPIGAAWLLISLPDQYKDVAWDAVYEGQKQLIANSTTKLGEIKTQVFNVTYPDPRTIEVKIDYTTKIGNPWMAVWNLAGMKVTFGHLVALAICIPLLILGIFTHNAYIIASSGIIYALMTALFGIDMVPLAILPSTPGEWSAGLSGTANSLASKMVAWVYSFMDQTVWDSGVGLRANVASLLIVISAAIMILKLKLGKK
jgi:hypothetical protein